MRFLVTTKEIAQRWPTTLMVHAFTTHKPAVGYIPTRPRLSRSTRERGFIRPRDFAVRLSSRRKLSFFFCPFSPTQVTQTTLSLLKTDSSDDYYHHHEGYHGDVRVDEFFGTRYQPDLTEGQQQQQQRKHQRLLLLRQGAGELPLQ